MDDQEHRRVRAMWVVYRVYPSWDGENIQRCNVLIVAICEHEDTAKRHLERDPRCQYSVAPIDAGKEAPMT